VPEIDDRCGRTFPDAGSACSEFFSETINHDDTRPLGDELASAGFTESPCGTSNETNFSGQRSHCAAFFLTELLRIREDASVFYGQGIGARERGLHVYEATFERSRVDRLHHLDNVG